MSNSYVAPASHSPRQPGRPEVDPVRRAAPSRAVVPGPVVGQPEQRLRVALEGLHLSLLDDGAVVLVQAEYWQHRVDEEGGHSQVGRDGQVVVVRLVPRQMAEKSES